MNVRRAFSQTSMKAGAGLALAMALLVLILVLMSGLETAQARTIQGAAPGKGVAQPRQNPPSGQLRSKPTAGLSGVGLWTPLGGPTIAGGFVGALAVDPGVPGSLYAAVQSQQDDWTLPAVIYHSSDGAAGWTAVYTTATAIRALAVAGSSIYAGTYNRYEWTPWPLIYRSADGGLTWTTPLSMANGTIWTFALHPTLVQTALAGGGDYPDKASLYRTDDGGATWAEVFSYTQPGWFPTVNAALIDPSTPQTWLISHDGEVEGTGGSYIWRSANSGATWTRVYTLTEDIVSSLVANPAAPGTIYAGTYINNLFRSTDGGATWTPVITDSSAGQRLVLEPPATLVAAQENGEIRKSTDGGDTWGAAGNTNGPVDELVIDLGSAPAALYAGLRGQGIQKSTDGGATWQQLNSGIETPVLPRDVELDAQDPARMFVAGDCAGGWMTADGGATWTKVDWACSGAFAINPQDSDIVYGGNYNCNQGAIIRSDDGGLSFAPVYTAPFILPDCSGGDETILDVDIAPSLSSIVVAAGLDHPNWGPEQAVMLRSADGGASWTQVFTLPPDSRVEAVSIDPTDAEVMYAGGRDCSGATAPGCVGFLYRTDDGGDTWGLSLVTSNTVTSIAIDPQKPDVLYVGDRSYTIRKSSDGGDTWTVVRACCPSGNLVSIDPNVPSHVYLGGWGYIAESPDGGQTWSEWDDPINQGTPTMEPRALAVDRGTGTQSLYAGFTGVWSHSRPAPQPGPPASISMWTDPPGPLYANGQTGVFFRALLVDDAANWVADGTPVTVDYDLRGIGEGQFTIVKDTHDGQVRGGLIGGVVSPGVVTFTATAAPAVSAFVTSEFLYDPPAAIAVTAEPASIGLGGETAVISATLTGLHGGVASNGTVVTFHTSLGTIDATTLSAGGVATATLTSGSGGGTALVTATTDGLSASTTVQFEGHRVYLPLMLKKQP